MGSCSVSSIRKLFLDFFVKNGHTHFQSAPLVAEGDTSLLFTNAGMVPFKQRFISGSDDVKTAVSSQKCLRAGGKHNDLENVGYTNRHHTFFEMLGNFSFGGYFKDVAIEHAWKFVTKELGLSKDRLWITVYVEDQEAFDLWKKITGFPDERIIKISTHDNFWSMGDIGPCGPCSEIFYDYGEGVPGGLPGSDYGDGARYTEIWNLVFMQYNRSEDGTLNPLPHKCIDTGMGLERIAAVVQGVCDNYDTDLFKAIIAKSQEVFGNNRHVVGHRVIADHVRAAAFLISEGLIPGNEGRGYVLRRIIRRAVRYACQMTGDGTSGAIHGVVMALTREGSGAYMGDAYPEIVRAEKAIISTLQLEEEGFVDTLRKGTALLDKEIAALKAGDVLRGDVAFKLYDTYGFPLDITLDIAKERGLKFDQQGFDQSMLVQKTQSRKNWVGSGESILHNLWERVLQEHKATVFVGYHNARAKAAVIAIVQGNEFVSEAKQGESAFVLLDVTPFYAESGGQEGDRGTLTVIAPGSTSGESCVVDVLYTRKVINKLHVHECCVRTGILRTGDLIEASIDEMRRADLRANHSATHVLHSVLREYIAEDIQQKGSLVAAEKLRFDYSHTHPMTKEQILIIEREVNNRIMSNIPVFIDNCSLAQAIDRGALALFGEKYSEHSVRVVSIASSKELCCGTHVKSTGEIGAFKIISESSIALGIRRIEAITGREVVSSFRRDNDLLLQVSECLGVPVVQVLDRLKKLFQEKKELNKQLLGVWSELIRSRAVPKEIGSGVTLRVGKFISIPVDAMVDFIREEKAQSAVTILSAITPPRAVMVIGVSKEAGKKLDAMQLVKLLGSIQGKGGGNANLARVSLPVEAVEEAESMIREKVRSVFQE